MKAILLVAGRGSRLGELTSNKPKSLVELNGKSLLLRAVESLRKGGVNEIGAVGGYRSEQISPHVDTLFVNPEWSTTGIFRSLLCASEWLKSETCIISYGDIFYSDKLVKELIHSPGEINITWDPTAVDLWRLRCENPLDDMETFSINNSKIVTIGDKAKSLTEIEGQYMGLLKITPVGWSWIEEFLSNKTAVARDAIDMTGLLSQLLSSNYAIFGTENNYPWGEVDTPADLDLYHKIYSYI